MKKRSVTGLIAKAVAGTLAAGMLLSGCASVERFNRR